MRRSSSESGQAKHADMVPLVCRAWISARRTPLEGSLDGARVALVLMGVVLLVRHGQASFGADDYDVLSETGWEQSRLLGRYLADRGVTPTSSCAGTCAGTGRRPRGGRRRPGGATARRPIRAGTSSTTSASWPRIRSSRPGDLDRRAFQRLFELATAALDAGRHDADYAEPWPAFRRAGAGALDRARAGRAGWHGGRGQLRRPDRRRLRHPRRSRRRRPRDLRPHLGAVQHGLRELRRHPGPGGLDRRPDADVQRARPPRG